MQGLAGVPDTRRRRGRKRSGQRRYAIVTGTDCTRRDVGDFRKKATVERPAQRHPALRLAAVYLGFEDVERGGNTCASAGERRMAKAEFNQTHAVTRNRRKPPCPFFFKTLRPPAKRRAAPARTSCTKAALSSVAACLLATITWAAHAILTGRKRSPSPARRDAVHRAAPDQRAVDEAMLLHELRAAIAHIARATRHRPPSRCAGARDKIMDSWCTPGTLATDAAGIQRHAPRTWASPAAKAAVPHIEFRWATRTTPCSSPHEHRAKPAGDGAGGVRSPRRCTMRSCG